MIKKADGDQIAQVCTIFIAISGQFHSHQRFERNDLKFKCSFRLVDFGQKVIVVGSIFLTGKIYINTAARFALRSVDKHIDIEPMMINEARKFERGARRGKIDTPNE